MHRVISVQSLKFYEQRQQENQRREANTEAKAAAKHAAQSAQNGSDNGSKADELHDAESATPRVLVDREDRRGSLVLTTLAPSANNGNSGEGGEGAKGAEDNHEKTITIVYHDKKDSNIKDLHQLSAAHSSAAKTQSVILVDEVVRRRREKLKRSPRGVWHGLGIAYQLNGEVDLDLVNVAKGSSIRDLVKSKQPRSRSTGHNKDAGEATKKVEALVDAFRAARVKMLQTSHEAIREREKEREKQKQAEQERRERLDVTGEVGGDIEHTSRSRASRVTAQGHRRSHSKFPSIASHSSSALTDDARSQHAPATSSGGSSSGGWSHLNHSRLDHIARWRNAFDSTKQTMDRELIKKLVARAETRALVFQRADYMKASLNQVMKRKSGRRTASRSQQQQQQQQLSGEAHDDWRAAIENEFGFMLADGPEPLQLPNGDDVETTNTSDSSNNDFEEKTQLLR